MSRGQRLRRQRGQVRQDGLEESLVIIRRDQHEAVGTRQQQVLRSQMKDADVLSRREHDRCKRAQQGRTPVGLDLGQHHPLGRRRATAAQQRQFSAEALVEEGRFVETHCMGEALPGPRQLTLGPFSIEGHFLGDHQA